jgi:hypothetical protein
MYINKNLSNLLMEKSYGGFDQEALQGFRRRSIGGCPEITAEQTTTILGCAVRVEESAEGTERLPRLFYSVRQIRRTRKLFLTGSLSFCTDTCSNYCLGEWFELTICI